MYRPRAFAVDDVALLHDVIRTRAFATVAAMIDGRVEFGYAPVVLDPHDGALGAVRFHLAAANPISDVQEGAPLAISFMSDDAYVSPDWYETSGMVPTWNYIAVEGRGAMRHIKGDALRQLLTDLTAPQEARLAPKKPWTIDKIPAAKFELLLNAIVGFSVPFDSLEGKFKLSQNVKPEDHAGVVRGLEARNATLAMAMKKDSQ
jgi:transcriptional regulator